LVKITKRKIKKRCLNAASHQQVYEYQQLHIPIPKRLHEAIEPLQNKDLCIDVEKQGETVVLTFMPFRS
jgi:hypothetical protein